MKTSELYAITHEFNQTVADLDIAYGNGFDQHGKDYFVYLLRIRPEFKAWVWNKYPGVLESLS